MSAPRRRSLIKKKASTNTNEIEALEATEDSDLDDFDMFGAEDEDLEVVEPTLRNFGSFDEFGPTMDSAVMDEFTDELPAAGLWMDEQQRKGLKGANDVFRTLDPEEYAPTEPGLPVHELLPPPAQQQLERVQGIVRTPTPPPAPNRRVVSLSAVAEHRNKEADRYMTRVATVDDLRMAMATPWLAAMGMSIGIAVGGMALVLALAVFFATRPRDYEPPRELNAQPPIEAPVVIEPIAVPEPEEGAAGEADTEEAEPEPEPGPRPRAAPAAMPEPEPEPEPEPVVEELPPEPVPVVEPAGPAVDEKGKKGLFRKKK